MSETPQAATERVGSLLGGRYRLVRKLGEGGMGVVYEAVHVRLDQRFAVKLLGRALATGSFVARFEREARAAAKLTSRHVARVFDVDTAEDGSPFFAMELLEGRDLHAELSLRGRLPWAEAARVVQEACVGMADAHDRGIIHRDLKPANLFLHRQDGGRIVKVLDFGISKSEKDDVALTRTQQALGTPLYMSPEQIRSPKHVDARTDVWSLGVILYEALSGRPPFVAETVTGIAVSITNDVPTDLSVLCDDVPAELDEVVRRAMSKRFEDRFATARELGAALAPLAGPELADVLPNLAPRNRDEALESTVSADMAGYGPPPTAAPEQRPVAPAPKSRLTWGLGVACFAGVALVASALGLHGVGAGRDVAAGSVSVPATLASPAVVSAPPPSSEVAAVKTSPSGSASASDVATAEAPPPAGSASSVGPPARPTAVKRPPPPPSTNAASARPPPAGPPPAFL